MAAQLREESAAPTADALCYEALLHEIETLTEKAHSGDSGASSPAGSTHSSATTVTPAATPLGKSRFARPAQKVRSCMRAGRRARHHMQRPACMSMA
jgi:hypothetical protein